MAQNLQLLKRRITTAKNISQIAKAMEMISASKIKRAQNAVTNNQPYAEKITFLTEKLLKNADLENFSHPFLTKNESGKKLVIAISPDKGLSGSLNTNLYKKLLEIEDKDTMVVTIGKKFEGFAARTGMELIASFPMGTSIPKYTTVYEIIRIINQFYKDKKISEVNILFAGFKSLFQQVPTVIKLLPIERSQTEEEKLPYKFEPDVQTLLADLLPHYIEVKLYNSLLNAHTSEQAARMVAMQNAKNNALDIADFLTLSYNKSRQEKITAELLDLTNSTLI